MVLYKGSRLILYMSVPSLREALEDSDPQDHIQKRLVKVFSEKFEITQDQVLEKFKNLFDLWTVKWSDQTLWEKDLDSGFHIKSRRDPDLKDEYPLL